MKKPTFFLEKSLDDTYMDIYGLNPCMICLRSMGTIINRQINFSQGNPLTNCMHTWILSLDNLSTEYWNHYPRTNKLFFLGNYISSHKFTSSDILWPCWYTLVLKCRFSNHCLKVGISHSRS